MMPVTSQTIAPQIKEEIGMKNSRVKLLAAAAALVLTLLTACGTGSNNGIVTDAPVLTDRPATQAPAVTDEPDCSCY